ncbi:regulatory protein RecX [Pseudomonas sp. CGJS7]|uniref:regulatory protein RecX n=1 Tax=Pseudomonas sp. CGJS7 TaxID=3109348 RepID=UPI00300A7847
MSSDRDDGRRHGGGADGTAGQGGEPSPGRGGSHLQELRARMRAIETGGPSAQAGDRGDRVTASARADSDQRGSPDSDTARGSQASRKSRGSGLERFESQSENDFGDTLGADALTEPALSGLSADPRPVPEASAAASDGDGADDLPGFAPEDSLFGPDSNSQISRGRRRTPREQTPTQRALGLLTRREHSRKELTRKLTSRGLDRDEVVAAVDRLTDAGWQNDARFAESLVRARAGNGYGPVHIRAELAMHGLDSQAIAEALLAYEGDWLDNARELARRRYGEGYFREPALRRKAADLLLRRGFDGGTVRNANRSCAED